MSVHASAEPKKRLSTSTNLPNHFPTLRKQIYNHLGECRDLCKLRHSVLLKNGNCFESVKLGADIRTALVSLHEEHQCLAQIYRQENKAKRPWHSEVDEAFDDIELLGHLIAHTEDAYNRNLSVEDIHELVKTITDIRTQYKRAPSTRSLDQFSQRDLTGVEVTTMRKWRERDAKLDKAIDLVGQQVDNLGTVARAITQAVDEQIKYAKPVEKNILEAKSQMTELKLKIRSVVAIEKKRGVCVCRTVLAFILAGLIITLFMLLKSHFIDPLNHTGQYNSTTTDQDASTSNKNNATVNSFDRLNNLAASSTANGQPDHNIFNV